MKASYDCRGYYCLIKIRVGLKTLQDTRIESCLSKGLWLCTLLYIQERVLPTLFCGSGGRTGSTRILLSMAVCTRYQCLRFQSARYPGNDAVLAMTCMMCIISRIFCLNQAKKHATLPRQVARVFRAECHLRFLFLTWPSRSSPSLHLLRLSRATPLLHNFNFNSFGRPRTCRRLRNSW